jgi:hypothetical protein
MNQQRDWVHAGHHGRTPATTASLRTSSRNSAGRPSGVRLVACEAHWVAVYFARRVLRREARRVRIAAYPADTVTSHAIGMRALVMAAGAADDVIPGCRAVKARAARGKPACGVRIVRAGRGGRQSLGSVTVRAETGHVTSLAARLVRVRVDGVTGEVIAPVDEVPVHLVWVFLRGSHRLVGMTVRAKSLLVAHGAGCACRSRDGRVRVGKVTLVTEEADGFEGMVV